MANIEKEMEYDLRDRQPDLSDAEYIDDLEGQLLSLTRKSKARNKELEAVKAENILLWTKIVEAMDVVEATNETIKAELSLTREAIYNIAKPK